MFLFYQITFEAPLNLCWVTKRLNTAHTAREFVPFDPGNCAGPFAQNWFWRKWKWKAATGKKRERMKKESSGCSTMHFFLDSSLLWSMKDSFHWLSRLDFHIIISTPQLLVAHTTFTPTCFHNYSKITSNYGWNVKEVSLTQGSMKRKIGTKKCQKRRRKKWWSAHPGFPWIGWEELQKCANCSFQRPFPENMTI